MAEKIFEVREHSNHDNQNLKKKFGAPSKTRRTIKILFMEKIK